MSTQAYLDEFMRKHERDLLEQGRERDRLRIVALQMAQNEAHPIKALAERMSSLESLHDRQGRTLADLKSKHRTLDAENKYLRSCLAKETKRTDALDLSIKSTSAKVSTVRMMCDRVDAARKVLKMEIDALDQKRIESEFSISGDLEVIYTGSALTIPAAHLNAVNSGVDTQIDLGLHLCDAGQAEVHCGLTYEPLSLATPYDPLTDAYTPSEMTVVSSYADGDITDPTVETVTLKFVHGFMAMVVEFKADSGATMTYQAGDYCDFTLPKHLTGKNGFFVDEYTVRVDVI